MFITGPPIFVNTPSNQSVVEGSDILFHCEALADPPHSVTWLLNDTQYLLSTDNASDTGKYSINRDISSQHLYGSLTVHNVQYGDHGYCTAMNYVGSVSATAILTVHGEQ